MAQWFIWQLQSDTLGLIPAVAGVSFFSFLPDQVEFHLNRIKIISLVITEILAHLSRRVCTCTSAFAIVLTFRILTLEVPW